MLNQLPTQIEELEKKAKILEEKLNDATLYATDSKKFNAYATDLTNIKNEISEKENLWLELQILLEENS